MQTFTITKAQAQSYYAIRIFGITQIAMAMGIIVMVDGPSDGLGALSRVLLTILVACIAWLIIRIYRAAVQKRIYGHFVLTKSTLAIKMPGVARVFVRRQDCSGILLNSWVLLSRGGQRVSLRTHSWNPYRKELLTDLAQTWWPDFASSTVWSSLRDGFPLGVMNLRINFRRDENEACPMLVFTPRPMLYLQHYAMLAFAMLLAGCFSVAVNESWHLALAGDLPIPSFIRLLNLIVALMVFGGWAMATVYVGYELFVRRALRPCYVLTRRMIARVEYGAATQFLSERDVTTYIVGKKELVGPNSRTLALGPYFLSEPSYELLRCLWAYWRPDRSHRSDRELLASSLPTAAMGFSMFVGMMLTFGQRSEDMLELAGDEFSSFLFYYIAYASMALVSGAWMCFLFWVALTSRVDVSRTDRIESVAPGQGEDGASIPGT